MSHQNVLNLHCEKQIIVIVKNKKSIMFLINPKSGVQKRKNVLQVIEKNIDTDIYDVHIERTQYAGHATELARNAAERGFDAVVAVGGDGTVNEVGRALVHTKTAMGVIPCGSGNGFARHLGIPIEINKAVAFINKALPVSIDYGKINGNPFFCACGVGFDALVSNDFAKGNQRGMLSYVQKTLKDWVTYKPETYTIETEYSKDRIKAFVIACGNASQYGNNAYIAPYASMRDNLLTVSIMFPFTPLDVPAVVTHLFTNKLSNSGYTVAFNTPWVKIIRKKAGPAHYDGEPCEMDAEIFIETVPAGINVLAAPGWNGTCEPLPLYRQFFDVVAGNVR